MTARVSAPALKEMLSDGGELALLDVREEGAFGAAHLLFASSLPLSRLELRVADLVPRRGARVVVCDGGEGLAERAARRLLELGYGDVSVLDGGTEAWAEAGYVLFSGVNVPSKAFGELVEQRCGTPHLSAAELKARLDAGADVVVLDSRPMREFANMCIPGAIDVPGAELAYRVHDLAPSPETLVVVNCAGRTRSIIGAQSLVNAGVPNPVAALENGTMGWHLAGFELERGKTRAAPEVSERGLARAREAARRVGRRCGVRAIGDDELARWRREADERTLYLFDVRSPEEYDAGHVAGAVSAPGGQLVQATDAYMATRGARVVLADDNGVRATMTASWLLQMGWPEVAVYAADGGAPRLESGQRPPTVLGLETAEQASVEPPELASALERGEAAVVDLASSRHYAEGHIPGAWFAIRSRLASGLARVPEDRRLVLTSEDGALARLALAEARAAARRPVAALAGGTAAWRGAGLPLRDGLENLADEPDDIFMRPYDRDFGVEQAMRDYLSWEVALVEQVEADGDARFRIVAP